MCASTAHRSKRHVSNCSRLVSSTRNTADIGTKFLSEKMLSDLMKMLLIVVGMGIGPGLFTRSSIASVLISCLTNRASVKNDDDGDQGFLGDDVGALAESQLESWYGSAIMTKNCKMNEGWMNQTAVNSGP